MSEILKKLYAADPRFKTGFKAPSGNIVTPLARASFVWLFKPQQPLPNATDKTPKFAVTLLFPAEADLGLLKNACNDVIVGKWGPEKSKWPCKFDEDGNQVITIRSPFRDQGEKTFEGYVRGSKFVTITSKQQPGLLSAAGLPITEEKDFYSGAWCWATVNPFAYAQAGNNGVAFGLQNVQKIADDEKLGGRPKAESEFAPVAVPADAGGPGAALSMFD